MNDPTWRRVHTQRLLSLPTERCFCVFCLVSRNVFVHLRLVYLSLSAHTVVSFSRQNHIFRVKHHARRRAAGPRSPSPTPTTASRPQRRRYKRRERKQKRGKRGGIRARLAANPHKLAIPTIVLANVRSLDNKLDYIQFNSIQVYLYSAFYDTIVAKQLYRKLSFYNIFIHCRNLIY